MNRHEELVHLEIVDRIATITLDSEHNRNALSRQLVTELVGHLATAGAAPGVLAVLLRSAGRVFCSGADLSEASAGDMVESARTMVALQRLIATLDVPVVVELGGAVRAGGLGILGAADVVIAADSVTFALTEVRLALAPAVISLSLLPRMTDRAAAELFLTGREFGAKEAAGIGLVTRIVPGMELMASISDVLDSLRLARLQGLRETKALVNHDLLSRIDQLGEEVAAQSARLFASDEAKAAMATFLSRATR